MPSPIRAVLLTFAALLVLVAANGCAHYRLGTGAQLPFATLYIAPVSNDANLPQAVAIVSTQLRDAFQRDGRVALVDSAEAADAVLSVSLVRYERQALTARTDDAGLARKFGLTLNARITLLDKRSGKNLIESRAVAVERQAFTDSGQLLAEYVSLPLLAEALSTSVTHAVLDVW